MLGVVSPEPCLPEATESRYNRLPPCSIPRPESTRVVGAVNILGAKASWDGATVRHLRALRRVSLGTIAMALLGTLSSA